MPSFVRIFSSDGELLEEAMWSAFIPRFSARPSGVPGPGSLVVAVRYGSPPETSHVWMMMDGTWFFLSRADGRMEAAFSLVDALGRFGIPGPVAVLIQQDLGDPWRARADVSLRR